MMSKALFLVLIGCTVAFASPANEDVLNERSAAEELEKIVSAIKDFFKNLVEKIKEKLGKTVNETFEEKLHKLKERLHSQEYDEAIEELSHTVDKINNAQEQLKNDDETREYLEKEAQKVGEAFVSLVHEAAAKNKNHEAGPANAEEFQKAVHEFSQIVDKAL